MTKFRMYDYALGRFLNVDPLADAAGQESWTPYHYVRNNPIGNNDPYGDCDWCLDALQTGLDVAGMVPAIGNVADLANAGISFARGDKVGGMMSLAAAVPGAGLVAGGAKLVKRGINVAKTVDKASDAAKVVDKAGDAKKSYQTYTKVNKETGEVYSGRTSGTGTPAENVAKRDKTHHMNDKGFGPAKLDKSSTNKDAIRGREQQLIDANGGAKSTGGTSGNAINGVGSKNKKAEQYKKAAEGEFGGG